MNPPAPSRKRFLSAVYVTSHASSTFTLLVQRLRTVTAGKFGSALLLKAASTSRCAEKKQIFTVITHQTCIPYTTLLPHQTRELQLRTRLRFMISQVRPLIKGQAAATAGPHPDLGILPALFPSFCSASCRFSSDLNCISCPDSEWLILVIVYHPDLPGFNVFNRIRIPGLKLLVQIRPD